MSFVGVADFILLVACLVATFIGGWIFWFVALAIFVPSIANWVVITIFAVLTAVLITWFIRGLGAELGEGLRRDFGNKD